MSEDRAQQNADAQEAPVRRGRDAGGAAADGGRRSTDQEPDVLLDVSELAVERITLEVGNLRVPVSVLAEQANLVSLSVGADIQLGQDKLEIEGVKAQVLLKVRLEHVRAILEKALDTSAEDPEILRIVARSRSDPVDEVLQGRLEEIRATLEEILERQGGIEGETHGALGEAGRTVRRIVDESGTIVKQTLDESGEVSAEAVVGEAEGTQEEEEEKQATPAAKRKAEELGVDLSAVEGTGPGGRITLRDVQSAAKAE